MLDMPRKMRACVNKGKKETAQIRTLIEIHDNVWIEALTDSDPECETKKKSFAFLLIFFFSFEIVSVRSKSVSCNRFFFLDVSLLLWQNGVHLKNEFEGMNASIDLPNIRSLFFLAPFHVLFVCREFVSDCEKWLAIMVEEIHNGS